MLNLELLRTDRQLLFDELRVTALGNHLKCPWHEDRTGSLVVRESGGAYFWACKAGCGEGDFIEAYALNRKLSKKEAFKKIEEELGARFAVDDKRTFTPPLLDLERAEKFIAHAHNNLMNDIDVQVQWMKGKRKLDLFTCEKFRLGFLENFTFQRWPSWNLPAAWVLPITNYAGELMGVKLHFEKRPQVKGKNGVMVDGPKCMWAPFGLGKRNAWPCLWPPVPPPQNIVVNGVTKEQEWLYVCPGELKALRLIADDLKATSPTAGEAQQLPDFEMARLAGHRVRIIWDNDEAGRKWRDAMVQRCNESGVIELETMRECTN